MSKRKKMVAGNIEALSQGEKIKQAYSFCVLSTLVKDYVQPDCSPYVSALLDNILDYCVDHVFSRFQDVDDLDILEEYQCYVEHNEEMQCISVLLEGDVAIDEGTQWGGTECMQMLYSYSAIAANTIKDVIDSITWATVGKRLPIHVEFTYSLYACCKTGENAPEEEASISHVFERGYFEGVTIDTFPLISQGLGDSTKEVITERAELVAAELYSKGVLFEHVADKIRVLCIHEILAQEYGLTDEAGDAPPEKDAAYLDFYLRAMMDFFTYILSEVYGGEHKIAMSSIYLEPDPDKGSILDGCGWEIHAALEGAGMPYKEILLDKLKISGIFRLLPEIVLYDNLKEYKAIVARMSN